MDNAPVFIKIDDYKDVVDILNILKAKISEGKSFLDEISALKNEEDVELEQWTQELIDVERKMETLEKSLIHP